MVEYINFRSINKNKNKLIFRSACVDLYSDENFENILKKNKINFWLDFRTQNEIYGSKKISDYKHIIYNFPIMSDDTYKLPINPIAEDYLQYYVTILKNNSKVIKDIIKFLSDLNNDGNVCISCYAGKDRTGIISYIIQNILEYDKNVIKDCYVQSGEELYKYMNLFSKSALKKGITIEEYSKRFLICEKIFTLFEVYFQKYFNNLNSYFELIGVNSFTINKIKLLYGEKNEL